MDPRRYNGAILLGLNGVVVKSHGGTDALGFAHAVDVAMDMVNHRFNDRIREGLSRLSTAPAYAACMDHVAQGLRLAGLPGGPASAAAPAATESR